MTNWDVTQSMVPPSHTTTDAFHSRHREVARRKHRKNYECSPGGSLVTASHLPSVSRLEFLNMSGIVNFIAPNAFALSLSRCHINYVLEDPHPSDQPPKRLHVSMAALQGSRTLNSKVT